MRSRRPRRPRDRVAPIKPRQRYRVFAALALALALGVIAWWGTTRTAADPQPVGLFTTLPILWAETAEVADLIGPQAAPHWARSELARHGPIVALDTLAPPFAGASRGGAPLGPLRRLVIAQPRPLSPQENIALDAWVRGGGDVLLIADPALTEASAFPLGDPRRPQATVLLSPILGRWGLELTFDDAQPYGEVERDVLGAPVPTNLAGRLAVRAPADCRVFAAGLAVSCRIGKGRVLVLADAAVLERDDPAGARRKALQALLDAAFAAH